MVRTPNKTSSLTSVPVMSEGEIIERIQKGETFTATDESHAFIIKIDHYVPFICTAIHAGGHIRNDLQKYFLLDEQDRHLEEDPYTADFISSMPITLMGCDSRYEYDLNRPKNQCIYFKTAMGKSVWSKPLSKAQRSRSQAKHLSFYRVYEALISKIEQLYNACLVFDLHTYNYKSFAEDAPTFNLGTIQVEKERWSRVLSFLLRSLGKIKLPQADVTVAENKVFQGRGYLIGHTNAHFDNTLVLPLEVKKIFMDEATGKLYPLVLQSIKPQLKDVLSATAAYFSKNYTRKKRVSRSDMLGSHVQPLLLAIDKELYQLAKGIDTLSFVNPINLEGEKKRFLSSKGNYAPQFNYRHLNIDPYLFREHLYRLPVDQIADASIQQMYREVVDGLAMKIDLIASVGTDKFLYNSLRIYGEPKSNDLSNANFLLRAPQIEEESKQALVAPEKALEFYKKKAREWGMECKFEISGRIVANAVVSKRTLLINKNKHVTKTEMNALAHHELGVHLSTTINAQDQTLKILTLGLADHTRTQEGLAILSEFLSGNMTIERLQMLAWRVMAVDEMIDHGDFRRTFRLLKDDYGVDDDTAFTICARVHRGGGFTKDYLYLSGLRDALRLYKSSDLTNLFVGKTGFSNLTLLNELVSRGIVQKPKLLPEFLEKPADIPDVLTYVVSGIQ
jgi:uncharacterized protein (TIGR02421 family)